MQKEPFEIKRLDTTRILFILKGMLIGAIVGVIVSSFRLSIEFLGEKLAILYPYLKTHPVWLIFWIAVSALLAILCSLLVKSDKNIKGSGIPQVEAQLRGELHYNWFSVLWKKFVGGILSVGAGLFLGREGPSIQLGAAVGQGFSELTKSTTSEKKIFISSGSSAGLAAAFNAPIAGLLFVLEEVHHSFSPLIWLTSFGAALTANFVSLNFFGLKPVLYLGKITTFPLKMYGYLVILGILLGFLGYIYQKVLLALPKLYKLTHLPEFFHPLVPFLLVIPIGMLYPLCLGGGNKLVLSLPNLHLTLAILIGLFLLRFIFSMISYGSGLPGGIFLPILTLGAIIGVVYGTFLTDFFGVDSIYIKSFLVLAMAGYFTAIGKAPLTAIILVTEMVGSLNHLMALGLVSLVAYVVNDMLGGNPIYESLLERLVGNKEKDISGHKTIVEYPVTAESRLDGMMVRDFNWPEHMLLVSIRRGSAEVITKGDTVMKAGDTLQILTDDGIAQKIKDLIAARSQIAAIRKQESID